MISDEELKNRQAFEAALVGAGSLMSTAWDDDYDEYVYDDAEQMYRGWTLAQEALKSAPQAVSLEGVRKWEWHELDMVTGPGVSDFVKVSDLQNLAMPVTVANIPEVDAMVTSIESALDSLYRRKPTDIHDGLGDHLGADQWDALNVALGTAKKVSELVHLMEDNSLAEGPSKEMSRGLKRVMAFITQRGDEYEEAGNEELAQAHYAEATAILALLAGKKA